jgi:4-hydroxy-3-methylbut-2-enyl diphosphate reductase
MKTFNVPANYRSEMIGSIKRKRRQDDKLKKDLSPSVLDYGTVTIFLARHFGFCYGVENAIEIAFRTIEENPGKRIFLLSEMIHNPQVNADLIASGVKFLQDTSGRQIIPFSELKADDIVLIPAFGTTLEIERQLKDAGATTENYNTTCPFVEKVWNRSSQISQTGYSIVIHGKPTHEETRATFSHAAAKAPSLVINDMNEAVLLASFIRKEKSPDEFYQAFPNRYSDGFDPSKDLERIGVVNQTTQLASDTQAIADFLKQTMQEYYALTEAETESRFADTRDTLCYATNDNQSAVTALLDTPADFAVVVGGYNSSNTTHLVEICEGKLPTYFINGPDKIISHTEILHFDYRLKTERLTKAFLPQTAPVRILMTSGASCPDAVVEQVIERLVSIVNSQLGSLAVTEV